MITFPNAKINLGLYITAKRNDGYHNIITAMIPCGLTDILEFVEAEQDSLNCSGLDSGASGSDNLVMQALYLLRSDFDIPMLRIHLHKVIPTGAGLGGGSSDAAYMLNMLNTSFDLGIENSKLKEYAARLGSDCAFFIDNRPVLATGRGEKLDPLEPFNTDLYLVLVNPGFPVSTREAYAGIIPALPESDLRETLSMPVTAWKGKLENQFEKTVFKKFPQIGRIKKELYEAGAVYAAMSGSGSTVFGIFTEEIPHASLPREMIIFKGKL